MHGIISFFLHLLRLKHNIFTNWDVMEKIWYHIFYNICTWEASHTAHWGPPEPQGQQKDVSSCLRLLTPQTCMWSFRLCCLCMPLGSAWVLSWTLLMGSYTWCLFVRTTPSTTPSYFWVRTCHTTSWRSWLSALQVHHYFRVGDCVWHQGETAFCHSGFQAGIGQCWVLFLLRE